MIHCSLIVIFNKIIKILDYFSFKGLSIIKKRLQLINYCNSNEEIFPLPLLKYAQQ